jgi:hypothetical protein
VINRVTAGKLDGAPAISLYHRPVRTDRRWCAGSSAFWCADSKPFPSSVGTIVGDGRAGYCNCVLLLRLGVWMTAGGGIHFLRPCRVKMTVLDLVITGKVPG